MEHSYIVTSPEQMNQTFARAYNSGHIENILALYEPGSCHVSQTGVAQVGFEAIRMGLQDLQALKGHITSENQYTYRIGEIALLRARWHLVGTKPDGEPLDLWGGSAEVVRQQPDGRWLYVIDHPFGADS